MTDERRFTADDAELGWLSNLHPAPVAPFRFRDPATEQIQHPVYPSPEHYVQSEKFRVIDPEHAEAIRNAGTPQEAQAMAQDPNHPVPDAWEAIKERVMLIALHAKFTRFPCLQDKLLATAGQELVAADPEDAYWGIGPNGDGHNRLGQLLMALRGYLADPGNRLRVIVAGSRTIRDGSFVNHHLTQLFRNRKPAEIVSGGADGVDLLGEEWAQEWLRPVRRFPAAWGNLSPPDAVIKESGGRRYNAKAGADRNVAMAQYANALVAFWDGQSKGTKHMIDTAEAYGLDVRVIRVDPEQASA